MPETSLELPRVMVERVLTGQRRKLDRIGDDLASRELRITNAEKSLAGANRRLDQVETP